MTDVTVTNHGSIMLFRPETDAARDWIEEHVDPAATWWAGALAVEPRYARDLSSLMVCGGLVVE